MKKRLIPDELYRKMGCPDLTNTMYFWIDGKKVYGKVEYVNYFKKKGFVYIGIEPFKKPKVKQSNQ